MMMFLSYILCLIMSIEWCYSMNNTLPSSQRIFPSVKIYIPERPWEVRQKKIEEQLIKEDSSEVEEFSNEQQLLDNNRNHGAAFPDDPFGPTVGINPLFPTGAGNPLVPGINTDLQAFTARRAIDQEILPGNKVRFLDTVTQIGRGWNNISSEFVCEVPGIFFFTFTACGERYRHFRITLKHNLIGVVSAYGDVSGYQMATNSAILRLLSGDRVYLELNEGGIYEVTTLTGRAYNTFSGFRIL